MHFCWIVHEIMHLGPKNAIVDAIIKIPPEIFLLNNMGLLQVYAIAMSSLKGD
jgi:hypothetical protein